jgi:hypothetical protein
MTSPWWSDDDQLLAALDSANRAARAVPRRFVELSKATYAWHGVDAELAALTFDSAVTADGVLAEARSEAAPLRTLTFVSVTLTIELEVWAESLLGQLVPAQPAELAVHAVNDQVRTTPVDELGCFVIRPVPAERFRLQCRTAAGTSVLTSWVSI